MSYPLRFAGLVAISLLVVSAACTSSTDSTPSTTTGTDGGQVGCANDPRVTPFASGMQAKSASGRFTAQIVTASPSPPQRGAGDAGMNEWTMKFTLDGAAPPADQISVTTLMPDHGHGSPRVPAVSASPDGTYSITGLYLFMAGVWQITFTANGESAMFSICVE